MCKVRVFVIFLTQKNFYNFVQTSLFPSQGCQWLTRKLNIGVEARVALAVVGLMVLVCCW